MGWVTFWPTRALQPNKPKQSANLSVTSKALPSAFFVSIHQPDIIPARGGLTWAANDNFSKIQNRQR